MGFDVLIRNGDVIDGGGKPARKADVLKLMSIEEAIRKMTSLPAHQAGLKDRGLIAKGFAADLVVFNPDTIADHATLKNPCEESVGIEHVLLNSRIVVDGGTCSPGQLNGKVLRRNLGMVNASDEVSRKPRGTH